MRAPDSFPSVSFEPAPIDARVKWTTVLTFLIMVCIVVGIATRGPAFAYHIPPQKWHFGILVTALACLAGPLVFVVALFGSRINRYELDGNDLVVRQGLRSSRFSLEGLTAIEREPKPLNGARRIVANHGVGAFTGRYKSARLGNFRVFVTAFESSVALHWPGRSVVVSPAQPDVFIESVQARIAGRY